MKTTDIRGCISIYEIDYRTTGRAGRAYAELAAMQERIARLESALEETSRLLYEYMAHYDGHAASNASPVLSAARALLAEKE